MGRTLEAYRKFGKSRPKLVAELDIDAVILSWAIECPARHTNVAPIWEFPKIGDPNIVP